MKSNPYKIYPQHIALASMILDLMIETGYVAELKQKQKKEASNE